MRQRNTFMLLSLVVVILSLSAVYAAITNVQLSVKANVTATPDQANFKVGFTGTPTSSGVGTAVGTITSTTTATIDVSGLTSVGDKSTTTFTVGNKSKDITAYLSCAATNNNTEYFKVTTALGSTEVAPVNGTTTLAVTVELIKTPITANVTDTVNVGITASPTPIENGGTTEGGLGREGKTVKYDSNNDGVKEDWIVLTDEVGLVEIVSASPMGSLTLGAGDTTVNVTTDLDGDGTVGNDGDKEISSYNNAITTINDYCKSLVTATNNQGVRSVGASSDTAGNYSSTKFNSWFKNSSTVKVKAGDEAYKTDYEKMEALGIAKASQDYWMASRIVYDEDPYEMTFLVRLVNTDGSLSYYSLWSVDFGGNVYGASPSYAVRPVVINPSGI